MASKEIKNELKSARESLQNKDYHAALKHCKVRSVNRPLLKLYFVVFESRIHSVLCLL
jgi:hypothetical protein